MSGLQAAINLIEKGSHEEGLRQLREIAAKGDAPATFVLANLYWTGTIVAQDPIRGRELFEMAASLGHGQSNVYVTNFLASGIAGKRDWTLAIERLEDEARMLPQRAKTAKIVQAMQLLPNGDPDGLPEPEILSQEPDARLFKGLLTPEECSYLIEAASDRFEPSMVFDSARKLVRDSIRTSDGTAFYWHLEDAAVHAINRRVAAVSNTDYEQGEALQVLRYAPGQEYRPHFDYVQGADNRRLWTALIYLNNDYEGGATAFVRTGLEVRGSAGDVLLFRNARPDDSQDPLAEHAGRAVTAGTKYLATRWIRERRWVP